MSLKDLEARLSYNSGDQAISIFRRALEDCRDGRYAMRGRREQLLGDFVSIWQELEFTIQQSQSSLSRLSSYSAIQRLSQANNQAQRLSAQAVGTLASCIPTLSNDRQRDRAQYLLTAVSNAYEIPDLIMTMQSMRTQIEIAMQHAAQEDAVDKNYVTTRPAAMLPEDEGYGEYDMSRGPSMARGQSRQAIYQDSYESTPRYASSTKSQLYVDGDESYGYSRQAAFPRESSYNQPRGYGRGPAVIEYADRNY
jgi:hypothetical protein